jgi:hypothetical protein
MEIEMPEEHAELLIKEYQELVIQFTTLNGTLSRLVCDVAELKTQMKTDYVNRREFEPVRNIVYGAVGLILMAVLGALIALVVQHSP